MASILSIGVDKKALADRQRVLREAGFEVVSSGLDDSLDVLARSTRFRVAIFGPSVPEEARNRIAAKLIRSSPQIKIVMLYEGKIRKAEMANAVLASAVRPKDLVQTIRYLTESPAIEQQGEGQSA
jgi:hypothetical protein